MTTKSRSFCIFAGLALLVALPVCSAASTLNSAGAQLQVNTNSMSQVRNPVAAYDSTGRSMVVWENDLLGLRGRLFDAAGNPLGNEISLAANAAWSVLPGTSPVTFHRDPAIAFLPSGDFLLAWAQEQGNMEWTIFFQNLQVHSREIIVQRFNVSGAAVSAPNTISGGGVSLKSRPRLAVRPGGDVLAVWDATYGPSTTPASQMGVFSRLLNASGQPLGAGSHVDQGPAGTVGSVPAIAVSPDSSFLVAWDSQQGNDSFNTSVQARAFDASGAALSAAFSVSGGLAGPQMRPSVASDGHGNFLVAWQSYLNDIWHARIHGQIVGKAGNLLGKPVVISKGTNGTAEVAPTVVAAPGGTFVLVWMEYNTWFPNGMAGVEVDSTGQPLGAEAWINSGQIGAQYRTALSTDGEGHYVAPFEGFVNNTSIGVLARFFTAD
jgi:hypothetical protein